MENGTNKIKKTQQDIIKLEEDIKKLEPEIADKEKYLEGYVKKKSTKRRSPKAKK